MDLPWPDAHHAVADGTKADVLVSEYLQYIDRDMHLVVHVFFLYLFLDTLYLVVRLVGVRR